MKKKRAFDCFCLIQKRKGDSQIISLWWIFLFILVAGAVAGSTVIVYAGGIDTRNYESYKLNEKISDCIIDKGVLTDEFFKDNFDIYGFCSLDKNIFEKSGKYYFKISLYSEQDVFLEDFDNNPVKGGNFAFEKDCEIKDTGVVAENMAVCFEKKYPIMFYKGNKLNKGYLVILSASNNNGEKISVTG